jgi:hypothetical protein
VVENLYPLLVSTKISPIDSETTVENLLHLFQITQFGLELKNVHLEDAESQIRTVEATLDAQEEELQRLRILSQGPESAGRIYSF